MDVLIRVFLRAESQIVHEEADQSANHRDVTQPLQRAFPELDGPRNMRVPRQPTIEFRLGSVMQHVNHAGASHARWVVHAGMREVGVIAKLLRASFSKKLHVILAAEVQAARRTRLDARRLKTFAHTIGAQRALEHATGLRVHLWNVDRAYRDAVAAPDAVGLLKIDDAIRVLHDGT